MADDVYQAVEDLTWDWSRERRQTWAIDTGTPHLGTGRHPLEIEADKQAPRQLRAVLGRARLKAERHALAAAIPDGGDPDLRRRVAQLDRHIHNLDGHVDPRSHPLAPPTYGRVGPPSAPQPGLEPEF